MWTASLVAKCWKAAVRWATASVCECVHESMVSIRVIQSLLAQSRWIAGPWSFGSKYLASASSPSFLRLGKWQLWGAACAKREEGTQPAAFQSPCPGSQTATPNVLDSSRSLSKSINLLYGSSWYLDVNCWFGMIWLIKGSLEVKLPTLWKVEKKRRVEGRRVRRKKIQVREMLGKSQNIVFFQWFVGREGQKVGSLKRGGCGAVARWEMKNCTRLWREAHFQVKMSRKLRVPEHFWKCRCRKIAGDCRAKRILKSKWTKHTCLEAVVAQNAFSSQNVQNTPTSDHFW